MKPFGMTLPAYDQQHYQSDQNQEGYQLKANQSPDQMMYQGEHGSQSYEDDEEHYQDEFEDSGEWGPGGYVPGGGYVRDQRTGMDANAALQQHRDNNPYPKSRRKPRKKKSMEEKYDYVCGCGNDYLSYSSLFNHWKIKHGGRRPPNCIVPTDRWRTGAKFLESGSIYQRKSLREYESLAHSNMWVNEPMNSHMHQQQTFHQNQQLALPPFPQRPIHHNQHLASSSFLPPPRVPPLHQPPLAPQNPAPLASAPQPVHLQPMSSSQRTRPFKSPSKRWFECKLTSVPSWTPTDYKAALLEEELEKILKQHDEVMVLLEKNFIQKVPGTGSVPGEKDHLLPMQWRQFMEEITSWFIGNQSIPMSFFQQLTILEQSLMFIANGQYSIKQFFILLHLQGQLSISQLLGAFALIIIPRLSPQFVRELLGMLSLLNFFTCQPAQKSKLIDSPELLTNKLPDFTNNFFPEYIRAPEEFESVTKFRVFGAEGVRKGLLNLFLELIAMWVRSMTGTPHPPAKKTSSQKSEELNTQPATEENPSKIEQETKDTAASTGVQIEGGV